jgi:hypothetical protein
MRIKNAMAGRARDVSYTTPVIDLLVGLLE